MTLGYRARTLPIQDPRELGRLGELTLLTDKEASGSLMYRLLTTPRGELYEHAIALIAVDEHPGHPGLVGSDRWVGWCLLWWTPGQGSNLAVYVAKSHRGQGIATRLVRRQAEVARMLDLYPHANGECSEAAKRLFREAGVRPYTAEYER